MALASTYVDEVGKYILSGGLHKNILNKPNSQNLLELFAYFMPVLQHASSMIELLESFHQKFKE